MLADPHIMVAVRLGSLQILIMVVVRLSISLLAVHIMVAVRQSLYDFLMTVPSLEVDNYCRTGPNIIKLISCSSQLSMVFILLINVKMPTIIIIGILTLVSRANNWL